MIVQPQSPPQRKPDLRSFLSTQWQHLADMSLSTLAWLSLPTLITFWFNPFLPVLAYALQLWAGQSWQWQARWGSIRMWARQGGWFVGTLVAFGVLADAHVWFFPALVALVQLAWHDHFPGELGLLPFPWQGNNLFARITLLLPLSPALALLYERIDPRTQVDPPRMLRPIDLVKPKTNTPPAQPSAPPQAEEDQDRAAKAEASTPPSAASKRPRTAQTKPHSSSAQEPRDLEQLTIDSFLAPDQGKADAQKPKAERTPQPSRAQPSRAAQRKKMPGREQVQAAPTEPATSTPKAKPEDPINWDDVAE